MFLISSAFSDLDFSRDAVLQPQVLEESAGEHTGGLEYRSMTAKHTSRKSCGEGYHYSEERKRGEEA